MFNQTNRIAELEAEKELTQILEKLASKVEELEKREQRREQQERFIKMLIDKKIPVSFARGRVIENGEQIETIVAETEAKYIENKK